MSMPRPAPSSNQSVLVASLHLLTHLILLLVACATAGQAIDCVPSTSSLVAGQSLTVTATATNPLMRATLHISDAVDGHFIQFEMVPQGSLPARIWSWSKTMTQEGVRQMYTQGWSGTTSLGVSTVTQVTVTATTPVPPTPVPPVVPPTPVPPVVPPTPVPPVVPPTPTNKPPVFNQKSQSITLKDGATWAFTVKAADPEGDKVSYTISSSSVGANAIIDSSTGKGMYLAGTKSEDLTVTATDTAGASGAMTISITVAPAGSSSLAPATAPSTTTTTKKNGGCGAGTATGIACMLGMMAFGRIRRRQ